jgi:uncharacterized iron-regulated membrane protein
MTWRRAHQLLALGLAVFWLIQVLTGVLLTFRQEIDNFLAGGRDAPLSVELLGRRVQSLQAAGSTVTSVWVTNFTATRFDVLYTDRANNERRMRVNGAGEMLRDGSADSFFTTLTDIHTTLLVGDRGKWIIAASGILLFSNLILGLKLAWPRRGYWKKSLALRTSRNSVANVYGLHRTLGLYIGLPLLVLVLAGILLCFDDDIAAALHAERPPPVASAVSIELTPAQAMSLGLSRFPGATLTALSIPTEKSPWYRVRLHAPGEVWRMYGQTTVFLSAKDGTVLQEYAAASAPPVSLALDWLYPLHTGEFGGVVARAVLVLIGLTLLTLGFLGIRLWHLRR